MFDKSHVAPSYRRLPHVTWHESISLVIDLLLGTGKQRCLSTNPGPMKNREVFVRGFSAGSYSGLCLLHLFWKLPHINAAGKLGGIACPPDLLSSEPSQKSQRLQLFHYTPDKLCCWQPTSGTVRSLACLCTIVENSIPELREHLGKSEHSYGHWLDVPLVEGVFPLWRILAEFPDAADPGKRDVAPLRFISWPSWHLSTTEVSART